MSTTRWDGAKVPTASDPILSAWGDYADSVGTFIRCASQAEAQARLSQAPAGVVSTAHPAMEAGDWRHRHGGAWGDGDRCVLRWDAADADV